MGTLIRPTVEDTAKFLAVSRLPSTSPLVVVMARLAASARSRSTSPLLVSMVTAPAAVVCSRLTFAAHRKDLQALDVAVGQLGVAAVVFTSHLARGGASAVPRRRWWLRPVTLPATEPFRSTSPLTVVRLADAKPSWAAASTSPLVVFTVRAP